MGNDAGNPAAERPARRARRVERSLRSPTTQRMTGLAVTVLIAAAMLGPSSATASVTRDTSFPLGATAVSELALADTSGSLLETSDTGPAIVSTPATTTPTRTTPMIRLLTQGPVVVEDGPFRLDLAVESPGAEPLPAGLGVAVTVHRRSRTRAQYQATVTGNNLGAVLGLLTPTPVSSDGRTEQLVPVELRIGPPSPTCPTCIRLDNDGVYPVNVELRNLETDDVVDRLTTHVIRISNQTAQRPRLKVAVVVPLHLAPTDDQSNQISTTRSFIERIEAMAGRPLVPLSVAPTPETIEALAARPDDPLLAQFRASLAGREVLAGPYVRWSNSSFELAQLTDELAAQNVQGTDVLRTSLGIEPTRGVLIAGNGIPSASALSRAGITVVLAEATDVVSAGDPVTAAAGPVLLNLGGRTATPAKTTLLLDGAIEGELTRPRDPARRGGEDVLRAQHILADLTMLAFGRSAQGIAIQIPENTPQATLDALLAGLGTTNPVIEPVTVSDLVALPLQTNDDGPVIVTRNLARSDRGRNLPAGDVAAIAGVRSRLRGYQSLFTETAPDLTGLSRDVSRLLATDLPTEARRRRLNSANRSVAGFLAQVRLSRPDQLTLTARSAIAPIGVINDTGFPIRVYVTVQSSSVRLRDSAVVVEAIGTTEVRQQIDVPGRVTESGVAIETRGPGSFSMVARLMTPDNLELSSVRYRLRSTAVSGLGTALTLGSLVVLLVWWLRWGRSARRRSRLRHPTYQPVIERRSASIGRRSRRTSAISPSVPTPPGSVITNHASTNGRTGQPSDDETGRDQTGTATDVNEPSVPV